MRALGRSIAVVQVGQGADVVPWLQLEEQLPHHWTPKVLINFDVHLFAQAPGPDAVWPLRREQDVDASCCARRCFLLRQLVSNLLDGSAGVVATFEGMPSP